MKKQIKPRFCSNNKALTAVSPGKFKDRQFRSLTPPCLLFIGILGLPACSYFSATDSAPETVTVPEYWTSAASKELAPVRPWLDEFSAPELNTFVAEAFKNNPSIQSLIATVAITEEQTWLSWSKFWPQINAGIRASRNQRNSSSGFSVSSRRINNVGFSLDFIWEIDLWYKLGNELEATEHDNNAALSDLHAAQLSLAANISKTWFDAIVAKQQIQLAEKTILSFSNALEIIERGYARGLYQALDVRLARTSLLNAQGRKENFLKIQDETIRLLEAQLGRYPSAALIVPAQLPAFSNPLPNSVPSSLLQRRPDIIAAEQRFFASDERMVKARKNMFPTIQISGNGGTSSQRLEEIFNPDFLIWNIAGNLTQPLFHGSQLFAERWQAEAVAQKAASDYAQIVLKAFQEVETTMAAEKWLTNQQQLLSAEVEESREAERLAENNYVTGLTGITTLLEAQRRAYSSESNLLEIRKQRLQNRVNLYLALGGPVLDTASKSK